MFSPCLHCSRYLQQLNSLVLQRDAIVHFTGLYLTVYAEPWSDPDWIQTLLNFYILRFIPAGILC
jgi:hypothetical protein